MNINASFNKRGITIIELLVGLVICAIVIAAIYRVFTAQSNAYVVQDQVVEVQQNIRSAMEIMVRDLRMAGFDYDNSTSLVRIEDFKPLPPYIVAGNTITVWYENYQTGPPVISQIHAVTYTLNGTNLERQLTVDGVVQPQQPEVLLENVNAFVLDCGIDGRIGDVAPPSQDGVIDNWVNCGAVDNNRDKVIAVRVSLTTGPEQVNPQDDRFRMVSPRTLTSIVALRNLSIQKF
ncbi:MAG: prepilin-type N-terminal cleavage/methylation domain-containing protein [Thermodesulfobacteriota bacterium]|nr:prepilin-type N-terminal cleavage/methylation domain-containing protein [Thermodesulfobacteriota bacterium]